MCHMRLFDTGVERLHKTFLEFGECLPKNQDLTGKEYYGFLDIVYARHFVNCVPVSVYWYLVPLPPLKVFLVLQLDVVVQDGLGLARVLAQAASEKGEERYCRWKQ
jgi:hypothetical protein